MTNPTIFSSRHDWADDDDIEETSTELPAPQTIANKDGTKTIITYRINEEGQKVKTTRRIRYITHTEKVNPRVADRKSWAKFGASEKDGAGPAADTTSVAENMIFRPSVSWRKDAKDESQDPNAQAMKDKLKDKKVKCRICNGEHFTARCPYKDTMAPIGENGAADVAAGMGDEPSPSGAGGAGVKKGSYVPPALRGGAAAAGAMAGSKYGERDDFATLRVTNVSTRREPHTSAGSDDVGDAHMGTWLTPHVYRFRRWPRRASCATCSSASVASPEYSWPRTERRAWPRDSPLSALRTGETPSKPATRWTDLVSSILFCAWSLPRRPSKSKQLHYRFRRVMGHGNGIYDFTFQHPV